MLRAFGYRSEQRKRSENQDSFGVFEFDGFTLAIVCDGMGGHVGGAQASSLAVRTVHDNIEDLAKSGDLADALRVSLERANQAIYEAARKNHRLMGMGTTAVAAMLTNDGFVHIAHVGDSRAYLINEGQAIQVTRDHTMVNLFVDAELLTPEDAATHPEAHVLSRSLGVERQVEVELSEPIEIAENDVILLCSDGVHGVVTDWELGSVDWAAPEPGVKHVLDIVEAREGDDNATTVAILIGDAPSMGTSPVPDPKQIEAQLSSGSMGVAGSHLMLPDDIDFESADDPDSSRTQPSAPPRETSPIDQTPSYIVEEEPPPEVRPTQTIGAEPDAPKAATPRPLQRKKETKTPSGKSRTKILIPMAAVGLLALLTLGSVVYVTQPGDEDDESGEIVVDGLKPEPPLPGPSAPGPLTPDPPPTDAFFAAHIPDPPRRLPHRPLRYTQPPPRGANMFQAVQAARDNNCAKSLDAVQVAMGTSPDHAKLYSQAWFCFAENHSRALTHAKVQDWEEFAELETHFRGWPEQGEAEIEWTPEDKRLPMWYRPAVDGIEYRLEAWARSTEDDLMREVMVDLKGEPSVADDFATDLLIEAQAAIALSRAPERTPDIEEAWARRVYVVSAALKGRVGKLLKTHRPELLPQLQELLEVATTRQPEGPVVPGNIAKAQKVGNGEEPPPIRTIRTGPKPDPIGMEPDLGPDPGGSGKTKIYK